MLEMFIITRVFLIGFRNDQQSLYLSFWQSRLCMTCWKHKTCVICLVTLRENRQKCFQNNSNRDFRKRNCISQVSRKQLGDQSPINNQSNERNSEQVCFSNPVKSTGRKRSAASEREQASYASDSLCTEAVDLGHSPRNDAILMSKICCQRNNC